MEPSTRKRMQHRGTRYTVHTHVVQITSRTKNKRKIQTAAQCIEKKDNAIAHRQITRTNYKSSIVPNALSPHLWIGAFLFIWPHLLSHANELRIAAQAAGNEVHGVFLGSLIHKRLHHVAFLKQTCIPISNVLLLCGLKDQASASRPTNRADTEADG